jgi:hypothetical protein
MEEEINAEAPGGTNFTIYIPNFLHAEYSLSEQSLEQQKNELLQKDWLTSGLIGEIESFFPARSEIKIDDDIKRDPNAFQQKIAQLFASGRIFASFKQLDQAADIETAFPGQSEMTIQHCWLAIPHWPCHLISSVVTNYHLINEVWPATFGTCLFQQIRGHLDCMLLGSKDEWELLYTSTKMHLLQDAKKFSSLEKIHNDPLH